VRVAGVVKDVQRSDGGLRLFTGRTDRLRAGRVSRHAADIFQPGITVVAEGRLGADGIFHARNILAKCPSRFSTTPYTS
jgi:cytochrome c-type biogenesis protein CcmE